MQRGAITSVRPFTFTMKSNVNNNNSFHVPFICFKTVWRFAIFTARVSSAARRQVSSTPGLGLGTTAILLLLLFLLGRTRTRWTEDFGLLRTAADVSWLVVADQCVV